MKIAPCIALFLLFPAAGCNRHDSASGPQPAAPATSAAGRRVDVTVGFSGYTPARITGKAGEQLVLVFHYKKSAGECGREVVVPGPSGTVRVTLTEDRPVEVPVTLPKDKGEVGFSCGMNMLHGALVVE